MELGFVGSEQEWQTLRSLLGPDSDYRVVAIFPDATPPWSAGLQPASSPVTAESQRATRWLDWPHATRHYADFEELLNDPQLQALVLAGPISARADRLRRAAQAGRHCLCFHPADLAAILYHEVAMLAADTKAVLVPVLPGRLHPAWQQLQTLCGSGSLGPIKTVLIEHSGPMPPGRECVAGSYAEAADLLSALVGEIAEVTAKGDLHTGRLIVLHRTQSGLSAEIRIASVSSEPNSPDRWKIMVEAERGRAELSFDHGISGPASLKSIGRAGDQELGVEGPGAGAGIMVQFACAVRGQAHTPSWSDAIHAAELAEWAWHSLDRRRSVDVYHEKRNELASFKGRMTSFGCGLIWLTLAMLILIAAGKGLHIPGMDWLAAGAALVWVVFLGLQALRWVFPREKD